VEDGEKGNKKCNRGKEGENEWKECRVDEQGILEAIKSPYSCNLNTWNLEIPKLQKKM
jgi:hypothetical protein